MKKRKEAVLLSQDAFNEVVTDSILLGSENYFGAIAGRGCVSVTLGCVE